MAMNHQADFEPPQPSSEKPSLSQAHQELVTGYGMLEKQPDFEEQTSTSRPTHLIRSYTDSADPHNTTDSCSPAMQNFIRSFGSTGSAVEVSESYNVDIRSNGHELKETKRISVKNQRIQNDGPTSEDGQPIQCDGMYLKLNTETYKLEMSKYFPDENDPNREKYLFKWIPTSIPRTGWLKVLEYYIVLDTSTSPPKDLKIISAIQENHADTDEAALVHRCEANPAAGFCMLFFSYEHKCYQIKLENGVPTVEKRESQDDLLETYMWRASL